MAYWTLWPIDLVRGQYTSVDATTTSPATGPNALDGDPSTFWAPGSAGSQDFRVYLGGAYTIQAIAMAGHTYGGTSLQVWSHNGTSWGAGDTFTPVSDAPFVYKFSSPLVSKYGWGIRAASGPADARIGVFSVLADYGYDSTGTQKGAEGYGILTLGNEGGVRYPIGRGVASVVGGVATVGGLQLTQRISAPIETVELQCSELRDGANQEWWKVRNSYTLEGSGLFYNPAWAKGVWLTSDEHAATAGQAGCAWYGEPDAPLDYEVSGPGGRVRATIRIRSRASGA